jgi:hypothetical protein
VAFFCAAVTTDAGIVAGVPDCAGGPSCEAELAPLPALPRATVVRRIVAAAQSAFVE